MSDAIRRRRRRSADAPPTIFDVAHEAGVSIATVSRVLADNYPVAASTRSRVRAAVARLDYTANTHARGLSGATQPPVAVLLHEITGSSFAALAEGVEQAAAEHGRLCLVASTAGDPDRELAQVELMREQRVAVLVIPGGTADIEAYRRQIARYARSLEAHGGRIVLCGRPALGIEDARTLELAYDNVAATRELADRVLELGHRDLLLLPGADNISTAMERLRGFESALAERTDVRTTVRWADFGRARARQATLDVLDDGIPFTAVLTGSDAMATGALDALRSRGLRCPQDVSVTGFDDVSWAQDTWPPLTTVRVPFAELGRSAVNLSLGPDTPTERVTYPTELVWRESVSHAPA